MALALPILSGLLLWAGFAPLNIALAPFIGIALFYSSLTRQTLGNRVLVGLLTGLSFFAPLLHWSSSYVGWFPWFSLALLQSALFALISILRFERSIKGVFLFASALTTVEIIRMKVPFGGFGWGRLGHIQVDFFYLLYPYLGVAGISFFVALVGSLLVVSIRKTVVILPIIPVLFLIPNPPANASLQVTAVQGGVDKLGLDFNEKALGVLNRHVAQTLSSPGTPDLFIWPENAADIDPLSDSRSKSKIAEVLQDKKTNLLVGGVLHSTLGPKNVSILYKGDGEVDSIYTKQDLAPFGEYMPLRSIAERVTPEAKRVRDFQPGDRWVVHEIDGKKFISVICFEVLDDDFIRQGARNASFIVAQTNNATFGKSAQAAQQLQIIRARAAELNREIAVVSTTGFTAHIDRDGSIKKSLKQFEPGSLDMSIATYQTTTLASRIGSWFWVAIFALALTLARGSVFSR